MVPPGPHGTRARWPSTRGPRSCPRPRGRPRPPVCSITASRISSSSRDVTVEVAPRTVAAAEAIGVVAEADHPLGALGHRAVHARRGPPRRRRSPRPTGRRRCRPMVRPCQPVDIMSTSGSSRRLAIGAGQRLGHRPAGWCRRGARAPARTARPAPTPPCCQVRGAQPKSDHCTQDEASPSRHQVHSPQATEHDDITRSPSRHARHPGADGLDGADELVAQARARREAERRAGVVDVEVRAADAGEGHPHDRVAGLLDRRLRHVLHPHVVRRPGRSVPSFTPPVAARWPRGRIRAAAPIAPPG